MTMPVIPFPAVRALGWGPGLNVESDIPAFENINRYPPARVGKACDFTQATQDRLRQLQAKDAAQNHQRKWAQQQTVVVEDGYNLVDTKSASRKKNTYRSRPQVSKWNQPKSITQTNYQEGILGQNKKPKKVVQTGRHPMHRRNIVPTFRDWSISVKNHWVCVHELALPSFGKMTMDARMVQKHDLAWCGQLWNLSKRYDRASVRQPRNLPIANDIQFYNPTTSADETIEALMKDDETLDVAATDSILSYLIAAGRSVYSWDITVIKQGKKVIFDKRDGSPVDFLTVAETAHEPPSYSPDDKDSINSPPKLGKEAARIQQNYRQAMVDMSQNPKEMDCPHPFADPDDLHSNNVAATCYRYRKFVLPGNKRSNRPLVQEDVSLVVRTEVDALNTSAGSYVATRCLNEFESSKNSPMTWRQHLESQPGAVLATELKNNSCKVGRWVSQAMLAGCDTIRLGYAVRQRSSDAMQHEVIAVQTQPTAQLGTQISLSENNAFGILRSIIDLVRDQEDGEYIFLKDPNKAILRLYRVGENEFEPEDEEEEEEEESDEN